MSLGGDKNIRRKPVRRKFMKKIWQKSLASMVSVALCLTAFVGCLTVNAAAKYNGTITSAGKEITTEATEAQIDLVVSATVPDGAKGMAYIGLKANTTFGTFKNVEVIDGAAAVDLLSEDGNLGYAIGADGQFIIKAFDTDKGVTSFTVRLTFKNDVGALTAGDEYPVEVKYLGTSDIGAANMDEESFAFTTNVGKITVKSSTPACEHSNATKTAVIEVTETEFIYSIDCPDCHEEDLTLNVPINNVEVAGNKVTRTIKPGNDIALWFMFKKDQQVGYTDLCLVVEKEVYEFSANEPNANKQVFYLTDPIDGYNSSGILCDTFVFDKLAAYEMTNEVSVKLYGYSAAKEMQLIKTTTYSIRQFLETKIKAGGNEYLMKTFVDILNYGAASQSLADIMINTDDLANSRLTEAQKAYGTQESEYCDTNTEFVDASKPAVYNYDSPVGYVTPVSTIAPESKVNIYFKFRVVSKDGTTTYFTGDVNNLYCRYYYTDVMGTDQVVDRHYDGLTRDGLNAFKFDLQPIAQLDKAVKAVVYYGDPNESSSYQIMEKEYSLEAFVKSQIGKATPEVKQLLQTMYAYGYSLKYCVDNGLV